MPLFDYWKNRLIDTTGRNSLLYFKFSTQKGEPKKNFLHLLKFDDFLLTKLLDGYTVSVNDDGIETQLDIKRDINILPVLAPVEEPAEVGMEAQSSEIKALPEEKPIPKEPDEPIDLLAERKKILDRLRLKDKTAKEDLGTNILFLSYGFLYWNEPNKDGSGIGFQKNASPLFLIPINIIKSGGLIPRYSISIDEDEPIVFNPALRVYLKQSFGITFDEVPDKLEEEINLESLNGYFETIDQVALKHDWMVDRQTKTISTFAFTNLAMYKEMEEWGGKIAEHSIIACLTSKEKYEQDQLKDAYTIDTTIHAKESHSVIDADSSQLEAIQAAKDGLSFVLDGPPGTGKSQTIVNIIAELMSQGKKVLFVSQKKAALDVVKSRLDSCSLGSFCLDLHNHQTKNKEFIERLVNSLNYLANEKFFDFGLRQDHHFEFLQKKREKLNTYANKLKEKYGKLDKTIFDIYAINSSLEEAPTLQFTVLDVLGFDETKLDRLKGMAVSLRSLQSVYSNAANHPWKHINRQEFITVTEKEELQKHIIEVVSQIKEFAEIVQKLYQWTDYPATENSFSEFAKLIENLLVLTENLNVNQNWFELESYSASIEATQQNAAAHEELKKLKAELESFTRAENLTERDLDELIKQIDDYQHRGLFGAVAFNLSSSRKTLINNFYNPNQSLPKLEKIQSDLALYKSYLTLQNKITAEARLYRNFYGDLYKGLETDWESILSSLATLNKLAKSKLGMNTLVREIMFDNYKKRDFVQLLVRAKTLEDSIGSKLTGFLAIDNWSSLSFDELIKELSLRSSSTDQLDDWIRFCQVKAKLQEEGLPDFLEKVQEIDLQNCDIEKVFLKRFFRLFLDDIERANPILAGFSGSEHTNLIESFQELDQSQFILNQDRVKQKIKDLLNQKSLFQKEIQIQEAELRNLAAQKRPRRKIRQIVKQLRDIILLICPCWMMSPLSVSQYIELNEGEEPSIFDTVIFDEASQIFPQDAICSIFRGKQLIVAGDPKQMPPTNIGMSSFGMDDDDEEEDLPEYESILDLVGSTIRSNRRLRWHYRSKYEELINPSNYHIYNGDLITFPQPEIPEKRAIELCFVEEGIFERKQNIVEANALVDKLFEVCQENLEKGLNKSIGVIAMGIGQQDCIRECLESRLKEQPQFADQLDEEKHGGFFIKNLENVQGDERDIIFLSVGYGKNKEGRFYQRFGPINQAVGYRRLNVAATRAKEKVYLFSSFRFNELVVKETSSQGVRFLQAYLKYAQTGEIGSNTLSFGRKHGQHFEEQLRKTAAEFGYELRTQIGCSNYRIDFGIVHPENPDKFVLGIECDGAMYQSAQTARERDRLRQQILERMGWKIHRIWSRDWWKNNKQEIKKVKKLLQEHSSEQLKLKNLEKV